MKDYGHPRHLARHLKGGVAAAHRSDPAVIGHACGLVFHMLARFVRLTIVVVRGIIRFAR